ncbi:MAG: S8 family serine peptidase [Chloroflexi bacterium]|nr:S8 family serine peptidase [Chloroflexota bacterium]
MTVPALQGWVSLVVAGGVTPEQVALTAGSAGGRIIEANARLGLYTLSVAPGGEGALIARLYQETWVAAASPTFTLEPNQVPDKPVKLVDFPYDPKDLNNTGDKCGDYHGDLTALQVARSGARAEVIDIRKRPWLFGTAESIEEAMKTGSVVNLSIGAPKKKRGIAVKAKGYTHLQGAWLAEVFSIAENGPDVPIVVSAGNGDGENRGQPLTRYIEALRKQFPNAAKKVRIVQATRQDGTLASFSDYSSVGSISALGEEVPLDTAGLLGSNIKCSGTSFAAPIVTALIDGMRKAAPGKSSAEIWAAFDKVTQGKVPWDWDQSAVALARRLSREVTGHGVATLQLDPPSLTIQQGKNQVLRPIVKETGGAAIDDVPSAAYAWSSSTTAVATVDRSGFVDGKSAGMATITASIDGFKATASVTVLPPPTPTPTPRPTPIPITTNVTSVTCTVASTRDEFQSSNNQTVTYVTWNINAAGNATAPENQRILIRNVMDTWTLNSGSWSANDGVSTGGRSRTPGILRQPGQPQTTTWSLSGTYQPSSAYSATRFGGTGPFTISVTTDWGSGSGQATCQK